MQDCYPALAKTFSATRLRAYHDSEPSPINLDVVACYAHNIGVSQKFAPALHIFEISLQNNVHEAFSANFPTPLGSINRACWAPNNWHSL